MYRNESNRTMLLFRSFLVNKLPPFFAAMLAVSMVTLPMEECISHALSRIDPNTFPSFSQMFSMQGNTALSDVRQEFLFSCASHKLIPESSIERLLGENPMQALPVGYIKDDLVAQISSNHERAEQLISAIELTEGNAGAIVGAITEVCPTPSGRHNANVPGHAQSLHSKRNDDAKEHLHLVIASTAISRCHASLPQPQANPAAALRPA
jgi:mediator of RNA polymerase II transcription subunit 5